MAQLVEKEDAIAFLPDDQPSQRFCSGKARPSIRG